LVYYVKIGDTKGVIRGQQSEVERAFIVCMRKS